MNHNITEPDLIAELSERGQLARFLPEPSERQRFIRQDYIQIKSLWSANFAEALSSEAHRLFYVMHKLGRKQSATPIKRGLTTSSSQGVVLAPLLAHLHLSLVPFARALTGQMLVPAHAWYNFYESNDGLWLHVDADGSELVFLTTVLGNVGPLHLHPDLRGKTQDELETLQKDTKWRPESGVPLNYPWLGLLAHRGHLVPHHRPGKSVSEPCAVAALHYSPLF